MRVESRQAIADVLLALADDELVLGHRVSEWCGHAPILEEDIAFANIALDEIGHANLWYSALAQILGQDVERYPDQLVYFRKADEYRNIQMVELPNGDWGFSILRQYLFDSAERTRLDRYASCSFPLMAETARKIRNEEIYHLRHSQAWVQRLCLGTAISHQRMQSALESLWPYIEQAFSPLPGESFLVETGMLVASTDTVQPWPVETGEFLLSCDLSLPISPTLTLDRGEHTPHLSVLLAEMQSVARFDPEATW